MELSPALNANTGGWGEGRVRWEVGGRRKEGGVRVGEWGRGEGKQFLVLCRGYRRCGVKGAPALGPANRARILFSWFWKINFKHFLKLLQ